MAEEAELTVRKIGHAVTVQLDTDGTPLWMGERMVETAPGEWMTPFGADLARVTAEAASELPETMFRTHTFDDSTDEVLTPVEFTPLDEAAEDEWYADGPLIPASD